MKNVILLLLVSLTLCSCSKKAPECGDKRVKSLTVELTREMINESLKKGHGTMRWDGAPGWGVKGDGPKVTSILNNSDDELRLISAVGFNKEVGSYQCSANYTLIHRETKEVREIPIEYEVRLSADTSDGNFIVSVNQIYWTHLMNYVQGKR